MFHRLGLGPGRGGESPHRSGIADREERHAGQVEITKDKRGEYRSYQNLALHRRVRRVGNKSVGTHRESNSRRCAARRRRCCVVISALPLWAALSAVIPLLILDEPGLWSQLWLSNALRRRGEEADHQRGIAVTAMIINAAPAEGAPRPESELAPGLAMPDGSLEAVPGQYPTMEYRGVQPQPGAFVTIAVGYVTSIT
jgi:hypothetical protein